MEMTELAPVFTQSTTKPSRFYVLTLTDADLAVDMMKTGDYQKLGYSVSGPRYNPDALPAYVDMYVPGKPGSFFISLHGTAMEHILKRTDLPAQLRKNLEDALHMFETFAPLACWGPAQHPRRRATPA
jgi:hypothetical protein